MISYIKFDDDTGILKDTDLAGFHAALANRALSVYAYIGVSDDPGWDVARTTRALFPALEIYLFSSIDDLRTSVPSGTPAGVVFGFDDQPDQLLTVAEASVGRIVRKAIAEALV